MNFFKKKDKQDNLSKCMQDEVIRIAVNRLGKRLSKELESKVRQPKWSYMGLEMIIDTVNTIDASEIEGYLSRLE